MAQDQVTTDPLLQDGDNIQQVSATPNPTVATSGEPLSIDVDYDATDEQLTGLGLRLHYDSSQIQFDSLDNVFQDDLFVQGSPQEDTGNRDGDEATDRFINVAWADTREGNWPGEGNTPQTLYTANFTPTEDFSDSTAINFTASDTAARFDLEADSVAINQNEAPTVGDGIEDQTTPEQQAFEFQVPNAAFSDSNVANNEGDSLGFSASQADGSDLPEWLSFNPETRTFSGTPGEDDDGTLDLQVTATDSAGKTASTEFALNVEEVNEPPQVANEIDDQEAREGQSFNVQVSEGTFSDPDGDDLTLSASQADGSDLPEWLSFDPESRTFSGTPGEDDDGTLDLQLTATDPEGETASTEFSLNVEEVEDDEEDDGDGGGSPLSRAIRFFFGGGGDEEDDGDGAAGGGFGRFFGFLFGGEEDDGDGAAGGGFGRFAGFLFGSGSSNAVTAESATAGSTSDGEANDASTGLQQLSIDEELSASNASAGAEEHNGNALVDVLGIGESNNEADASPIL